MKRISLLLVAPFLWSQLDDTANKARRAVELVMAGKSEEAVLLYQELAHAFPNDAGMLLNLAIAEFKARRYGAAAEHSTAVLRLKPDSLAANLFSGPATKR